MPRLLIRDEWFEAVASDSLYESEFESLLLANAHHLYPDFYLVKFKVDAESPDGTGRPDLALIEKSYRRWWVVEVELGHHPLVAHVLRQVRIFSQARYSSRHVEALARHPELERRRLEDMMRGNQPRVLVLVNVPRTDWRASLAGHEALLGVVELFRSSRNQYVLRINGDQPEAPSDDLSCCTVDRALARCLIVESPASLPDTDRLSIVFEDQVSTWAVIRSQDTVWLHAIGRYPLPSNQRRFILRRRTDGKMVLAPQYPGNTR